MFGGMTMFCSMCGKELKPEARFCGFCGAKINDAELPSPAGNTAPAETPAANAPAPQDLNRMFQLQEIPMQQGTERSFPFLGDTLVISSGMDAFIAYRKLFRKNAVQMQRALEQEYYSRINCLDNYFTDFPIMYSNYRKPLLESAFRLLIGSYGIYDISAETFEKNHDADFNRCNQLYEIMINAFNETIEANQNRKIRRYNMMPGFIFSGIGGIVAATAVNIATTKMLESSIRNANVSPAQRKELFQRIHADLLMEDVFYDYWNVHYSLTYQLNQHGADVWYPTVENNNKAHGLLTNIKAGLIPPENKTGALMQVFHARPQEDGLFRYLNEAYPGNPDIGALNTYFGYENGTI